MGPPRDKQGALSTFSYVFSELVQYVLPCPFQLRASIRRRGDVARRNAPRRLRRYQTTKIRSAAELETNLEKMGKDLGKRVFDALFHRDRLTKRELTEVGILKFISTTAWKALWGKEADSLERSNDREDEYMVVDSAPLVNQFVSVPANLGALDCAALMAGVIAGILDASYFAAKCTAHPREEGGTVFLIRIGHDDESEEQKEPELVEMRPVLPLADRALA